MKITSKMVGAEAKKARARKNPDQTRKVGIFNVRYVPAGGTLGPRNASGKTNGIAKAPQVEFYDSRYPHTPRGQFVTAYYAETLNDAPLRNGLLLDTGSPAWQLDRDELLEVKRMIARSGDFGPVLNPAKPTVSRKISQLVREGYPQRQAVAIALEEERRGKVRKNPRLDTKAAKAPSSRASLSARRMVYQVQESRDGKVYEPWATVLYPEMAKEIARRRAAERPSLFVRVMSFKVEV